MTDKIDELLMKELTLKELIKHLEENGGHLEGKGDGSIEVQYDDNI